MANAGKRPEPVDDLLRAVRAEISAVLNGDVTDGEKVTLYNGRRSGGSEEEREYLLTCKRWKPSLDGKKLLIRRSPSRQAWECADAARMPDGTVRVTTAADLGAHVQKAELCEDDTANLQALIARLESAGESGSPVNLTAAGWIVGQGCPRTARCVDPEQFIRGYRGLRLNDRQREAIEQALVSEITFIWGPPGTGKTDVVNYIVEGCYRQDLRVLFLAPTKVAVDQALERMCTLLSSEDGFDSGLVQRAGEIDLPSLAEKYGDKIDAGRIAERLTSDLAALVTRIRAQLEEVREGLALHERAAQLSGERRSLHAQRNAAERDAAGAQNGARAANDDADRLRHRINEVGPVAGIFAQRRQAKLEALQRDLWRCQENLRHHQAEHDTARMQQQRCLAAIDKAESDLSALLPQLQGVMPADILRRQATQLQERLSQLEEESRKISDAVRSRCRIMGTTVSKAVQSRKLMDTVDVVVIDEAGMVNLPSAWCAAGLAAKRVVMAGDFRQLPAVTKGATSRKATPDQQAHSRMWMDRDAFHAAGLVDPGGAVRHDPRLIALNTQYRMRPAICSVVNEVAYPDAPLSTGREDLSELPRSPLIEGPLVLVDTAPRRLEYIGGRDKGAHRSNTVHEAVIHELIRGLQYDTVLPARKAPDLPEGQRPTDRLAVIAPYRDQVKALQTSLTYRFGDNYQNLVNTVHRFQGSERPLVIIDTVVGIGDKLGYFYEGVGLSSTTCRLLNVALSRARDHLVVVADLDFLHRKLDRRSETARMITHLERHAQRLNVDDLVPFRSAADLRELSEEELARPAFFPADEVPRAVEWDIARAARSINLYCAFLDPAPVRRWLRHLGPRLQHGVSVTIHTRQQDADATRATLVRELQDAGCQVSIRERMHEKVLIIDDTVLWHGSLNLLANVGPTDLMMRITDPGACERVRHIVDRARMERPARERPSKPTTSQATPTGNGSRGDVTPGDVLNGRLYLNVPYEEKDEAKSLVGARWDKPRKLWHVAANVPREQVRRWLPPDAL